MANIYGKETIVNAIEDKKEEVIKEYNNQINIVSKTNDLAKLYYLLAETFHNTLEQRSVGIELLKNNFNNDFFRNAKTQKSANYICFINENIEILFSTCLVKEIIIKFKGEKIIEERYRDYVGYLDSELADLIEIFLKNKTFKNLKLLTKTYYEKLYHKFNKHYSGKIRLIDYINVYKQCNKGMLSKIRENQRKNKEDKEKVDKNNKRYEEQQLNLKNFINSLMETDLKTFKDNDWKFRYYGIEDENGGITY